MLEVIRRDVELDLTVLHYPDSAARLLGSRLQGVSLNIVFDFYYPKPFI